MILYNAVVHTINQNNEIAEAVLLEGNRITFVGSNQEVLALAKKNTQKIDCKGKALLPGFIDSHVHLSMGDMIWSGVDLSREAGVHTISDILEKMKKYAKKYPEKKLLVGNQLNPMALKENRYPTRFELDAVFPDVAVYLGFSNGHNAVINTKLMEEVNYFVNPEKFPDEDVILNQEGNPDGCFKENGLHPIREYVMPKRTKAESLELVKKAVSYLHTVGITSVHDAGGICSPMFLEEISEELDMRIYPMQIGITDWDVSKSVENFRKVGTRKFHYGPLKLFVDGSAAAGTCATREPLSDTEAVHPLTTQIFCLEKAMLEADEGQCQFTGHAVGDRAIETMLKGYELVARADGDEKPNARNRIEHCFLCPDDLLDWIAKLGVIPTFNPAFLPIWGEAYRVHYGERCNRIIPIQAALDRKIMCTIASDWPCIQNASPLKGIASAMNRKINEWDRLGVAQGISLEDALRCITFNGAYAEYKERDKGSLEVGKWADLVLLDSKFEDKTPEEIGDMQVDMTIFDGKIVYQRK
ncbi:amidohydrolase [Chakrabartyella piscis]|uniref:amidohydrolase n=1 Tax=Chakrabartyella piscis TaxID=2918914 RepID=UPI002958848A|nr:amidohydrolase [Chakrabartyella piscis]